MTINCLGKLIALDSPKVMGILNLSPDSFYDGGKYADDQSILRQVEKMLAEGATFVDVGAYSSRPGAADISEAEEAARMMPVIDLLLKTFPDILLSADTFRSGIARMCLDKGVAMVNDISAAGLDRKMMAVVAEYQVPFVMMHMRGNPRQMQEMTTYTDITAEVLYYFSEKMEQARALGINDIILDPGFGFAKTLEQNFELLRGLEFMSISGLPVLVGLSRKSMVYKLLNTTASEALNGTTALQMTALQKGANILRVHDVREAMECIALHNALGNKY
jgi:dihydropteroate synthase